MSARLPCDHFGRLITDGVRPVGVALAGRERELALVLERMEAALGGEPQVVVLLGEPGIGKTTLARAALDAAGRRGAATSSGAAVDDLGAPPYWPWKQVLQRLSREATISPELRSRMEVVFEPTRHGKEADRFVRQEAVIRVLREACATRPLAIVLDDVQWADAASLLLLNHLQAQLSDEPMLITVIARDTEARPSDLLAGIAGRSAVTSLRLTGLDPRGVGAQLASLVARSLDTDEVAAVARLTGGNPFLVRELGRQIQDRPIGPGDAPLTPGIRASLERRLAPLGQPEVTLLETGAVLGLEFGLEAAAAMCSMDAPAALGTVDNLVAAGLLEPGDGPTWRFPHALLREAVEARLPSSRRVAQHRAAAAALEELAAQDPGRLFELARHWTVAAVAGEREHAATAVEAAADEAMRQLGFETASQLYRQALTTGADEISEEHRHRLWLRAAEADTQSADHRRRFEAAVNAAQVARRLGRADLLAAAALAMSPQGPDEVYRMTRSTCEEALALVSPDDLALRSRLISQHTETYVYTHELNAFEPAAKLALELARQSGDPSALAPALRARQVVLAGPAHLEERSELADLMLSEGRRLRMATLELQGHLARIDVELERGNLARASVEIDAVGVAAAALRNPFVSFLELAARAVLALATARFDDCRIHISRAFDLVSKGGDQNPYLIRSAVLSSLSHHTGVDDNTLRAVEEARRPVSGEDPGLISALSDALVMAEAGRLDDTRTLYESQGSVPSWRPPPHVELLTAAIGIGVAGHLGRPEDALALRERLLPFRGHHVVCGTGAIVYFGPVELWTGLAARTGGLVSEAIADLRQAIRSATAAQARGFEAEAKIELAATLALSPGRARGAEAPRLWRTRGRPAGCSGSRAAGFSCWWRAGTPAGSAHPARGGDRASGCAGADEPVHRGAAVPLRAHRAEPCAARARQARPRQPDADRRLADGRER